MKAFLAVLFSLVILILGAALIVPGFIDWNQYKSQITKAVEENSDFKVSIDGDLSFSVLPMPRLSVERFAVFPPQSKKYETLAQADLARIEIDLFPLLSGQVKIHSVELVSPQISIEKFADGSFSWASTQNQAAATEAQGQGTGTSNTENLEKIFLDQLVITNGRLAYFDAATGQETIVEALNTNLKTGGLTGPFNLSSSFAFQQQDYEVGASIGKLEQNLTLIPIQSLEVKIADLGLQTKYAGLLDLSGGLQTQGEASLSVAIPNISKPLSVKSMITATEKKISLNDSAFSLGDFKADADIQVSNLDTLSPLQITADLSSDQLLALDDLLKIAPKAGESKNQEGQASSNAEFAFLPESLDLPFPVTADISANLGGISYQGQKYEGVIISLDADRGRFDLTGKVLKTPGNGNIEAKAEIAYTYALKSDLKSATLKNPKTSFSVQGKVDQMPSLLRAVSPESQEIDAFEIWKNARFNLKGAFDKNRISLLPSSNLHLDASRFDLSGAYTLKASGKPDLNIIATVDTLNLDTITKRANPDAQRAALAQSGQAKGQAFENPFESLDLPFNADFDLKAGSLTYQNEEIRNAALQGRFTGNRLVLENLSVASVYSSSFALKGAIEDTKTLNGIDLSGNLKTPDLKTLLTGLKLDASGVPENVKDLNLNVTAKGSPEKLNFDTKASLKGGSVQAKGIATNILKTPVFDNLSIGASHPDYAEALKIFAPDLKPGRQLRRPFNFSANLVSEGQSYKLNDLAGTLGPTALSGTMQIDMSGDVPYITGALSLGKLPLGAYASSGTASGSAGASGPANNAAQTSRWSRNAIDLAWMRTVNFDVDVKAQSIDYNQWNFINPVVHAVLKDGTLDLKKLEGGLFGGAVALTSQLKAGQDEKAAHSFTTQASMDQIDLGALATAMAGANVLKTRGTASFNTKLQSAGLSSATLINALQGEASLQGREIIIEGFDLARLARALSEDIKIGDSFESLTAGLRQGQTQFDTVDGQYVIREGIVNIASMVMDGPAATINVKGNANLPLWKIDLMNDITLKNAADDVPPFQVAIKGPLDNPGNTFGQGILEDYAKRKIDRKLRKVIDDKVGGKIGEILGGARQQPANDNQNTGGNLQEQKPAQDVQPEDVIRGVLDGFLR